MKKEDFLNLLKGFICMVVSILLWMIVSPVVEWVADILFVLALAFYLFVEWNDIYAWIKKKIQK